MTDTFILQNKIDALKAMVAVNAITPSLLGSLLDELLALQNSCLASAAETQSRASAVLERALATIEASERAVHAAEVNAVNMAQYSNDLNIAKQNAITARQEINTLQSACTAIGERLNQAEENICTVSDDIDSVNSRTRSLYDLGTLGDEAAWDRAASLDVFARPGVSIITWHSSSGGGAMFQGFSVLSAQVKACNQCRMDFSDGEVYCRVIKFSGTVIDSVSDWQPIDNEPRILLE